MVYAIGFLILLGVMLIALLFMKAKSKLDDIAIERASLRRGPQCPCPKCKNELISFVKAAAKANIQHQCTLRCPFCNRVSDWETAGDPPVLVEEISMAPVPPKNRAL